MGLIAVSGGFDPLHIGHVRLIHAARRLVGPYKLVVILNNDNWLRQKKHFVFMPEAERAEILEALRWVDQVHITDHASGCEDMSVCDALRTLRPDVFANGGDRGGNDIPEFALCQQLGIAMRFNVGGGKVQSSSWLTGRGR
jgi:cytidyltransferase-like protein